ncbi:MAG: L-seryl-tRNA(Sec) selenium transferase [Deltaproteobacteria bacterium]|nr:L-seryl-tRNA(Sec) selenium transferase [Deltaproteobacteria bacterium]
MNVKTTTDKKNTRLKSLPKIDELMLLLDKQGLFNQAPRDVVRSFCRQTVADLRRKILAAAVREDCLPPDKEAALAAAAQIVKSEILALGRYRLRRVVNATGIIIHTNLGRAPLCPEALTRLIEVGENYSNLEFDLEKGQRGLRYDHVQRLLCVLTGAEDALVVNNNAAAVLLALNTLADGREAIVSRGELIEIGGEFRIPEVMEKSGARLREVGTTNRTRRADYEQAISAATGVILKVHTSNFRMMGFTEEAGLEELVALGKKHSVPVLVDLGSGCFIELGDYGQEREPTVQEVQAKDVDLVTFSGDKLLGGPQAGIILGKASVLQKIKMNPLNRALRIDKLTLAALEGTLMQYLTPAAAVKNIRVLKALTEPQAAVTRRARKLLTMMKKTSPAGWSLSLKKGCSLAGGGALPTREIPTTLIALQSGQISAGRLEAELRKLAIPILVRIAADEVLLDLRTIEEAEFPFITAGLKIITEGMKTGTDLKSVPNIAGSGA